MNDFPDTKIDSLDPKNREQIISMARRLLRADNVGMFCTIVPALRRTKNNAICHPDHDTTIVS